jgi:N-acetylmuramoyl-L-alanine amidase
MKYCISVIFNCFLILLVSSCAKSQEENKKIFQRLDYLCMDSKLRKIIEVDKDFVRLRSFDNQKNSLPELTIFNNEIPHFLALTKILTPDSIEKILIKKGNRNIFPEVKIKKSDSTKKIGLKGKRIAIDAGHFAGNMSTAKIEQKFLEFKIKNSAGDSVSIRIAEGVLTWQTAYILKSALEKEGAIVMMTRDSIDATSFGISYSEWFKTYKGRILDSLKNNQVISQAEHKKLSKCNSKKFFWDFFRDYELANRVKKINAFQPDLTIIIHYNVDEKNTDWKKTTDKNFSMCFIGGGMSMENFEKPGHKINFLRLLLSDDLDNSERISKLTVNEFSKNLNIKIAQSQNADYLKEKCVITNSPGVFCRNLALCRGVNSPLVYGECLYQDNSEECIKLMQTDKIFSNIKTSQRVKTVADCYFNAAKKYFQE